MNIQSTLTIYSAELCETITERINQSGSFTTVTDNHPSDILPRSVALLSLDTFISDDKLNITHVGIIRKGQRVATGQARISVTDVIELPQKVAVEDLVAIAPNRFKKHVKGAFGIGYKKVGEKTGEELLRALFEYLPQSQDDIARLFSKLNQAPIKRRNARTEDAAAEKDALGIALDIFGVDRSKILRSWTAPRREGGLGNSFLNGLADYAAYEDDIISHDLHTLPGMSIVEKNVRGVVEFQNKEGEKLVVINANRKPLEKALGVDLIYFHRRYNAFTFVQYKMMDRHLSDRDNKELTLFYYNPNENSHYRELERMENLQRLLNLDARSSSLLDYRLAHCPIFFKLCKKIQLKLDDGSIAPGAYIPLDQWNILINDPTTQGPKGGTQIGYHTLKKRYLGTHTFVELVQRGFLGTQSLGSNKVALFIEDAIQNGHTVLYAIDESLGRNEDDDVSNISDAVRN